MTEFIALLLAEPAIRVFIEKIAIEIIADIFHRRTTDPVFLAASNQAFAQLAHAKTDQEITDAQNAIRIVMSH